MYDELVKMLRHSANFAERGLTPPPSELREAADAIEKLTAYARQIEELQKTVLRLEDESGILDELPMVDQREPPKAEEGE